jgi:hypothetical protein
VSRCGNIPCAEAELLDHLVGAGERHRVPHRAATYNPNT